MSDERNSLTNDLRVEFARMDATMQGIREDKSRFERDLGKIEGVAERAHSRLDSELIKLRQELGESMTTLRRERQAEMAQIREDVSGVRRSVSEFKQTMLEAVSDLKQWRSRVGGMYSVGAGLAGLLSATVVSLVTWWVS